MIRKTLSDYITGVLSGNRVVLSQAITLVESNLERDKALAQDLLEAILPHSGKAIRMGITGIPGVGKSTFLECFGQQLCDLGKTIAILAIDPSSRLTQGSIMGDKTRMQNLSTNPNAYIRPSPSGNSLGGVSNKTRETMLLCEAAGFDIILVETVGVGQSEVVVRGMVDFFLLLMLAGAGDELQGIKKGIIEMADALVITKADGNNVMPAKQARLEYEKALHMMLAKQNGWQVPVEICSAYSNMGMDGIWEMVETYQKTTESNGYWLKNRQNQQIDWFFSSLKQQLEEIFFSNESVKIQIPILLKAIENQEQLPMKAASMLLENCFKTV